MRQSVIVGWALVGLCSLGVPLPAGAQQGQAQDRPFVLGGFGSLIGVSIRELREADLSAAKLARPQGVFVESVQSGSPAERAGMKTSDIIVEYDGERVRGVRHFSRLVQESPAGRVVPLVVARNAARQTLSVTPEAGRLGSLDFDDLRDRIERRMQDLPFSLGHRPAERRLGLTLMPLSAQLASYFGVGGGVLVSEVVANSPAARASVKAGDIITSVNGRTVASPADVSDRLRTVDAGATVELTLTREKREVRVQIRLDADRRPRRDAVGI